MTMIDTPDGIRFYRLAAVRAALSIEVKTGLRHSRGSVLKIAKRDFGVLSNTKKGALAEMEAMVEGAQVAAAFARGEMFVVQPTYKGRTGKLLAAAFERGLRYIKEGSL
jgi:hypothetical protein